MSIYATIWNILLEDEDHGGAYSDAWFEVWCQAVPNHINEQNGYGGPGFDEWLPAFIHEPGCVMRKTEIPSRSVEPDWYDCDCGDRAYFICDKFTTKATPRNGQEYVNPLLVLTGPEYRAMTWTDMLIRLEEAVAARGPRIICRTRKCNAEATNLTYRNKEISEARCDAHQLAYSKRRMRTRVQ